MTDSHFLCNRPYNTTYVSGLGIIHHDELPLYVDLTKI